MDIKHTSYFLDYFLDYFFEPHKASETVLLLLMLFVAQGWKTCIHSHYEIVSNSLLAAEIKGSRVRA